VEFLKGDIMKPLAKSLHTVTVLVRVAIYVKGKNPELNNAFAVDMALGILGLGDMPDTNGLAEQAIKQLRKYA
jgi:hypothetical protein